MGLFSALGQLCTMPIRVAGKIVEDAKGLGDFDDSESMLALFTLGGSSILKGIGETIEKAVDELD